MECRPRACWDIWGRQPQGSDSDGIMSGWGVSYAKTLRLISARSFRDRGAGCGCNPSNLGPSPSREIFLSLLKVVGSLSTEEVSMDINVC